MIPQAKRELYNILLLTSIPLTYQQPQGKRLTIKTNPKHGLSAAPTGKLVAHGCPSKRGNTTPAPILQTKPNQNQGIN